MGLRIIVGKEDGGIGRDTAVMYCSTTGQAFGPLFDGHDECQDFIDFCRSDAAPARCDCARELNPSKLAANHEAWLHRKASA